MSDQKQSDKKHEQGSMNDVFTIGSLFAGVGGLDLGVERGLAPARVAWQVELDPWRRDVLAARWPEAKRYEDVRQVAREGEGGRELEPVDVIIGGFPCQGVSAAGKGKGLKDQRSGLWKEYARIVEALRPPCVIIENSPLLRSRGLNVVLEDLAARGYDAEWDCVPALAVGAPHRRDRIFIIAWRRAPGAGAANADRLLRLVEQRLARRRSRGLRDGEEAELVDGGALGPAADAVRDGPSDGAGGADGSRLVGSALGAAAELGARGGAADADRERRDESAGDAAHGSEAHADARGLCGGGPPADATGARCEVEGSGERGVEDRGAASSSTEPGPRGSGARGPAADADGEPIHMAGRAVLLPDAPRARADGRVADADGERRALGGWSRALDGGLAEPAHGGGRGISPDADGARLQGHRAEPARPALANAERRGGRGLVARALFFLRGRRRQLVGAARDVGVAATPRFPGAAVASVRRVDDGIPDGAHGSAEPRPEPRDAGVGSVGEGGQTGAQSAAVEARAEAQAADVAPLVGIVDHYDDPVDERWPPPAPWWPPQEAWPVRVLEDGERRPREDNKRLAAIGDAVCVPVGAHVATITLHVLWRELTFIRRQS